MVAVSALILIILQVFFFLIVGIFYRCLLTGPIVIHCRKLEEEKKIDIKRKEDKCGKVMREREMNSNSN